MDEYFYILYPLRKENPSFCVEFSFSFLLPFAVCIFTLFSHHVSSIIFLSFFSVPCLPVVVLIFFHFSFEINKWNVWQERCTIFLFCCVDVFTNQVKDDLYLVFKFKFCKKIHYFMINPDRIIFNFVSFVVENV